MATALRGALHAGRQAAADEQQPVAQVDVLPAQCEHLTESQAGVEEQPKRLRVLMVLALTSGALCMVDGWRTGALLACLARARECLDLFDLVVVEGGRRRLATLVGPRRWVDR